jgi:hypothetical protein
MPRPAFFSPGSSPGLVPLHVEPAPVFFSDKANRPNSSITQKLRISKDLGVVIFAGKVYGAANKQPVLK